VARQSSVGTEQTKLRRLHFHRLCRELSRLGVFPDILLDRSQFLLLSLTALLGPLLATLGLAFFHDRFASAARALAKASSRAAVCWRAAACAAEAAACVSETAGGAIAGCARADSELTASACA
jgi:hypothetical protein